MFAVTEMIPTAGERIGEKAWKDGRERSRESSGIATITKGVL
jgi:hypothetical protein